MRYFYLFISIILFCILGLTTLPAQIPQTLSYQGVLTDSSGAPKPDGAYSFTFRLYETLNGGSSIWSETENLAVKRGLFNTVLGDQNAFEPAVKFDRAYWLGIQVGNDPELTPRIPLTSVGYSFHALRADTADIALVSVIDSTWQRNGEDIFRLQGNVGIGVTNPLTRLHVAGDYIRLDGTDDGDLILNVPASATYNPEISLRVDNLNKAVFRYDHQAGHLYIYGDNTPMYLDDGNVGIGTSNPSVKLEINGVTRSHALSSGGPAFQAINTLGVRVVDIGNHMNDHGIIRIFQSDGTETVRLSGAPDASMWLNNGGKVGIGTANPQNRLHIVNQGLSITGSSSQGNDIPGRLYINPGVSTAHRFIHLENDDGVQMVVNGNGNVGIGTANPTAKLEVAGRTKTQVLEITGGADLAEPFEMSHPEPLPAGALVIIDEEHPGKLKLSDIPYDSKVAGVISGAGGINPGLTLTQQSVAEDGQNVALSGRVYALATASNGPIKPGDLLTTSAIPGHAMKATEISRSHGAVIGKAMSHLENGDGLVLVLIQPQ